METLTAITTVLVGFASLMIGLHYAALLGGTIYTVRKKRQERKAIAKRYNEAIENTVKHFSKNPSKYMEDLIENAARKKKEKEEVEKAEALRREKEAKEEEAKEAEKAKKTNNRKGKE